MTNIEYKIDTLPNGLTVAYLPVNSPVAYCGYAINAGTRDERKTEYGLAHFVEHMLFKGTTKRKAWHILNRMESVGGEVNAYTTKEETFLYSIFPEQHLERAIELLTDLVCCSRFPEKELEKEQTVVIDEIHSYEDSPADLIFDEFENMLYDGHELGHSILGTEESLLGFTSPHARSFVDRLYTPSNMVLFIMGSTPFDKVIRMVEAVAGVFPKSSAALKRKIPPTVAPVQKEVNKDTHQTHVITGCRSFSYTDDKRVVLYLINNMLGGPAMNSRLNLSLREKHGLVYNVESNMTSYTDTGFLSLYFGTDASSAEKSIRLVRKELDRLCDKQLTPTALAAAKKQLKGQISLSSENRENIFLSFGKSMLRFRKFESLNEMIDRIDQIDATAILNVSQALFHPDNLSTLIYR